MTSIGIMQGRLSPPVDGRIQVFPADSWREEFEKAAEADLYCIEWIYDAETEPANPLRTDQGLAEIEHRIQQSGVRVVSICADYYMTRTLIDAAGNADEVNVGHLNWLIGRAGALKVEYVVLPFVDSSSLKSQRSIETIISILKSAAAAAKQAGTELHLETDLKALALIRLLKRIAHPNVRANYDIGNSASLGHDPADELPLLGRWLGSVHVKDRALKGTTVPLGTGAADLDQCFRLIGQAGFEGPFILQVARDRAGNEIESAIRNRQLVERLLNVALQHA